MRTIKTLAGTSLELDGDVLAVIETVSRDLLRRQSLEYGFEDVDQEFAHLIGQLSEDELRAYLKESLFMSFNRYENEHLAALIRRAHTTEVAEDADGGNGAEESEETEEDPSKN